MPKVYLSKNTRVFISTREAGSSGELHLLLQSFGGKLLEFPMIRTEFVRPDKHTLDTLKELNRFSWLIFTSANGVKYFNKALIDNHLQLPSHIKIACIGNKTAAEIIQRGMKVDYNAESENSEEFATKLKHIFSDHPHVIISTGNLAGNVLEEKLAGISKPVRIDLYQTSVPDKVSEELTKRLVNNDYEMVFFYSPSAFINFYELMQDKMQMADLRAACIGPTTKKTCVKRGITPIFTAEKPDTEKLVETAVKYLIDNK